jgi:1-acyl-sn-glycerol-3-phosphate acyltransferase
MMFPEGTRSRTGRLGAGHPGTALIARRTNAPILPVAITGTEAMRWPRFFLRPRTVRHIKVVIGEPFHLDGDGPANSESLRRDLHQIMGRIAALLPEQYQAAPDEEPSPVEAAAH